MDSDTSVDSATGNNILYHIHINPTPIVRRKLQKGCLVYIHNLQNINQNKYAPPRLCNERIPLPIINPQPPPLCNERIPLPIINPQPPPLRNERMKDGWMTCNVTSFSTVFQSYQDDVWMIMKGCVQWNPVYS